MQIPEKSNVDFNKGNWIIYQDGNDTIQIYSSNINGKERIFLNNELVSEKRSFSYDSQHEFLNEQGEKYEVIFTVEKAKTTTTHCQIIKEGVQQKRVEMTHIKGNNFTVKRMVVLFLVSAVFGVIMAVYELPFVYAVVFIVVFVFVFLLTRDKTKIELVEH